MPQASAGYVEQIKYAWQHQPDVVINQDNPIQNTWYTVLPATDDVRIINAEVSIYTAVETLQMRITADGTPLIAPVAGAIVGTSYFPEFEASTPDAMYLDATSYYRYRAFLMEAHNIMVEVRKITALGAGILHSKVVWARLLPT